MAVEAQATARGVRTSAQTAGLVWSLIRGKSVNQAVATLQFTPKIIARELAKVLRSAVANIQQADGFGGDIERLYVSACYANQGQAMKRGRPAPLGRAHRGGTGTAQLTAHGEGGGGAAEDRGGRERNGGGQTRAREEGGRAGREGIEGATVGQK